ncbi:CAF1-domain-containing protein [Didymella exigua CBS 183.55]|uniref:CAF1-domain-containing protein n=1 Tax=Didymella exigua CBS 183.55 TaxID=1150837 RepID=A0A6A5RIL8_9PLEO|nr:CAF1-domain-containing protein [Didymella exigua CBS 183.55]KAF1927303.1 CAF1-domain-containing protein [Didymella exigua CBS 183.55]
MDVTAESFPNDILGLLIHISEAEFVSFDLELSGIPSRLPNRKPRGAGRLTLEDRYAETKEGADRYQILQVGLTCVKFDYMANKYVLRPYNIDISPLLHERLDFEREVTFQSGACSFLLGCGFDLGAPFARGVPYLSRDEAERAKKLAYDRIDKKNVIEDLQLKDTDTESLDFVRRCRDAISAWQKSASTALDITTSTGLPNATASNTNATASNTNATASNTNATASNTNATASNTNATASYTNATASNTNATASNTISRFEKRLVHQLVRAEFPDAVAVGRNDCIRILPFDAAREADNVRRIKTRVKEQIARQTGFRWIFEALVGGDVNADLLHILRSNGPSDHRDRFDRALARLKKNRPVLVGHNMFTDIVYLYRTFVGPLPDTLDAFNGRLHELAPRIVDTKYLATHDEGDLNASPTLEEIARGLQKQQLPTTVTHEDHGKYNELEAFHEAGYDSLLTATIMLRLAAKLGAERSEPTESIEDTTVRPAKPALGGEASEGGISLAQGPLASNFPAGRDRVQTPIAVAPGSTLTARKNRRAKRKNNAKTEEQTRHRFATKTVFEKLRELSVADAAASGSEEEEGEGEELDHDTLHANGNRRGQGQGQGEDDDGTRPTGTWADEEYVQDETGWVPIQTRARAEMEFIPHFSSSFWHGFGNRLRVFGTEERELSIAPWPAQHA